MEMQFIEAVYIWWQESLKYNYVFSTSMQFIKYSPVLSAIL